MNKIAKDTRNQLAAVPPPDPRAHREFSAAELKVARDGALTMATSLGQERLEHAADDVDTPIMDVLRIRDHFGDQARTLHATWKAEVEIEATEEAEDEDYTHLRTPVGTLQFTDEKWDADDETVDKVEPGASAPQPA